MAKLKPFTKDEAFMQRALDLAIRGFATTQINPMVGAVIVFNDRIIGEGFHEKYGEPHAEINALSSVSDVDKPLLPYSTMYVTLEPCSHTGKTPPCALRIVNERIHKVVVGTIDPNPKVAGSGIDYLKKNGVEVVMSTMKASCEAMLRKFKVNLSGLPYIQLKWAQSKDGFMGIDGKQIWLSNAYVRMMTHKYRSRFDGVLIGKNTALMDNPILDARFYSDKKPIRILLDRFQAVPETHHLYDGNVKTWIVNLQVDKMVDNICHIKMDTSDLSLIMKRLFNLGLTSVIIEGGSKVLISFIEAGLWHEAFVINTNKILNEGISAPQVAGKLESSYSLGDNEIFLFHNTNFEF